MMRAFLDMSFDEYTLRNAGKAGYLLDTKRVANTLLIRF
jgi:hypothetical protein